MEPILDELQNNDVDIDMRTLSHHVNCLLERHEAVYNQIILVRFGSKRVISVEWFLGSGYKIKVNVK